MPPMEFHRVADASMASRDFLTKFVGEYSLMGRTFPVTLENETTLILTLPMQPKRELEPRQGTSFSIKGMDAYLLEFIITDGGSV